MVAGRREYIHTGRETDTQTHRHDKHPDIDTDLETGRDRHTETQQKIENIQTENT